MQTKGIRILDKKNGVVSVRLSDILEEIFDGHSLYWSILDLYALGSLGGGLTVEDLEEQIKDSDKGLLITWDELIILTNKFHQIIDITLIGNRDKSLLCFYEDDQKMYKSCDIVIEMIDSSYWEVFSKEGTLIDRLEKKFKNIEFLTAAE